MALDSFRHELTAYAKDSKEDIASFDKNFFLVAFATFAFTVTFIKDIVPYNASRSAWMLALSWFLLGISLSLSICAYFFSAISNEYLSLKFYSWIDEVEGKEIKRQRNLLQKIEGAFRRSRQDLRPEIAEYIVSKHKNEFDKLRYYSTKKHMFFQFAIRAFAIGFLISGLFALLIYVLLNHRLTTTVVPPSKADSAQAAKVNIAIHTGFDDSLRLFLNQAITHKDSSILQIKPDTATLLLKSDGCSCPPVNNSCKKTCKRKK